MKRLFTLITAVLITAGIYSQAPDKLSYQAVVRNPGGVLVQSSNVGIKISLLQGSANGTVMYSETYVVATNANGLTSLEIGGGSVVSGNFATIDWSAGPYFLKTDTDPGGGTNYTISGISQLLSVPYAFYAANSVGTAYGNEVSFTTALAIGESYLGGMIAYFLQPGDPGYIAGQILGLIAAPSDQSAGIQWYNGSYTTTGATAWALGTGNANTITIVSSQGAGSYAAKLCYDLVLGGYSDWYLPSKDELNKLYLNNAAIGGFSVNGYWSSTESNSSNAWYQSFSNSTQGVDYKDSTGAVRAVRTF